MPNYQDVFQAVLHGRAEEARRAVEAHLADGASPEAILHEALVPAMGEVGQLFERQEYYVPEMLIAARAMQAGLSVLRPRLVAEGIQPTARAAIGTVQGDLHDIGKNLVAMMLQGAGFDVRDLGTDVPAEKFVEAARDGAQLIGISALLTTTMAGIPAVIRALEEEGVRSRVKVIVGGAPLTEAFARQAGADGYAPDASLAVRTSKALLGLD
jgi:5-methyltetrahydrofolate--homocysteine methyltransferase